jgi:peptidoglycan hydrolase-like protein with peptidoglycan-binding domain
VPSVIAPACRRSRLVIAVIALALTPLAVAPAPASAAQHLGQRALQKGDRGHDVRVLQDFLTRAGYSTPIAGVFGPQTLRNVKRFQRAHHLAVDGIVGAGTAHALRVVAGRRAAAKQRAADSGGGGDSEHMGDRTLKKGMRGHDVRVLQDYLTRSGIPTPVDGVFGPGTLRNVRRFQRAHGLTADGVVGPATEQTLRSIGEGGSAGDSGTAPDAPVGHARVLSNGLAVAPADAPAAVKGVIAAGNRIATKPYVYGGGHGTWDDNGYDCSGSVSYALHGGGLVSTQLDSTGFESYGSRGNGRWITVYANAGHAFMVVAGLRFDTSGASPSRWQSDMRSGAGYVVRHPSGF